MTKKRVVSVLLAVVLAVGSLPLVASANNAYEVRLYRDAPASGDGWSWDNEAQVLTMDGANITSQWGGIGFFSCDDVTINLAPGSTNTICAGYGVFDVGYDSSSNPKNIKITGEGSLTIDYNATSQYASDPRITLDTLTIEGGEVTVNDWYFWLDSLSVTGGVFLVDVVDKDAIRAEEKISVTGGMLTANVIHTGNYAQSDGTVAANSLGANEYTQSGGTITANSLSADEYTQSGGTMTINYLIVDKNCTIIGGVFYMNKKDSDEFWPRIGGTLTLKDCTAQFNQVMLTGKILIDNSTVTLAEKVRLMADDDSVDSDTPELIILKGVQGATVGVYNGFDEVVNSHVHTEMIWGPVIITPGSGEKPTTPVFTDVLPGAYYADAVAWAVERGITSGTGDGKFSPDVACTREQIVTFLWRNAGKPEPKTSANPFTDVKESDFAYKAILWAVENTITSGTGATTFSPQTPCTRGQAVTFLWRANGRPAGTGPSFSDVKDGQFYTEAVKWATGKKITSGTSSTTFSPEQPCDRGQIVTFLYRDKQ